MSIRPLDEQKCPLDIQMSIRPLDQTNRNVHWTFKCPFVQWTNRNVHWTSKYPFVHWTNGHCLMASTLVSCLHGVRLSQITSLQLPLDEQKCPLDIQMSIRPLDKQKCPLDIHMSICPVTEQKCPLDINICPLVHWTNRTLDEQVQWTN